MIQVTGLACFCLCQEHSGKWRPRESRSDGKGESQALKGSVRSLSHRTPPTSMAAVHRLLGPSWCQALVPWAVCRGTALSSAIGMLREEDHPPHGSLCEWRRLRAAVNIGPRCQRDRSPVLRQPQPKRRSHVRAGSRSARSQHGLSSPSSAHGQV